MNISRRSLLIESGRRTPVKEFDEVNDPDDMFIADWRGMIINRMRGMDPDKVADEARLARQTVRNFISGETICPTTRTFVRLTRAVDARIALLKSGASPKQTHELRFTPKERAIIRALFKKKSK